MIFWDSDRPYILGLALEKRREKRQGKEGGKYASEFWPQVQNERPGLKSEER